MKRREWDSVSGAFQAQNISCEWTLSSATPGPGRSSSCLGMELIIIIILVNIIPTKHWLAGFSFLLEGAK